MRGAAFAEAAAPAVQVVDAVGAGDSFDAGFVYGALAGWPLDQSLALAVACGALSTRAAGGTAAQATLAEALARPNRSTSLKLDADEVWSPTCRSFSPCRAKKIDIKKKHHAAAGYKMCVSYSCHCCGSGIANSVYSTPWPPGPLLGR